MKPKHEVSKELEQILLNFSNFIFANILRFDVHKKGIDPDDIFQEVRIKIWKLLQDEKTIKNYALYIKKIINSSVIDQIRKCRREEGILNMEKKKRISEIELGYTKTHQDDQDISAEINKAINSLINTRKKVVKLYLCNLNLEEISSMNNWSRDKTRNLLYRGLSDLRRELQKVGITYEDKQI